MEFNTINYEEVLQGVGQLTLNRPECLNAINMEMLDELYALFKRLQDDHETRVIILTGAGRGFCSGADLRDEALNSEAGIALFASAGKHLQHVQRIYSRIIIAMRRVPQPIIAAVNGASAGGGFSMALASDIILANSKAAFTASFVNIGLSGGELGTSYFLPRMVGASKASEILMTGRTVYAEEADRIGLVSRLVDDDQLMETALQTAGTLLGKSNMGLKFTKEAIRLNLNAPCVEAAVELEDRNQSICCSLPEFFEAVAAFVQK